MVGFGEKKDLQYWTLKLIFTSLLLFEVEFSSVF